MSKEGAGDRVNFDSYIKWTSEYISLLGFSYENSDSDSHDNVADFVMGLGPKVLTIAKEGSTNISIRCHSSFESVDLSGVKAYMLRSAAEPLTNEDLSSQIQYGTIGNKGLSLNSLNTLMKGLVEKQVSSNLELCSHYHRVMAKMTDTVHSPDSVTVLYCPEFDFIPSGSEASLNKEYLQIMESVVIHWTNQIKEVVNNNDSGANIETSGPLEEIDFWGGRSKDLLGLQEQLGNPAVKRIVEVLTNSESNYIGPFQVLTEQIVTKAAQANDNLKFLESIREQCTDLHTIEAPKIGTVLPDLINRIRLIWSFSAYYQDSESVCGLLRKISNEIIYRFRHYIPVRDLLDGDVEMVIRRLKEAIDCGLEWKALYHKTSAHINKNKNRYEGRTWKIETASIFAQIDAFLQRCKDLIEVGESQMQFVRKSSETGGDPGPVPKFGGTKATEVLEGIAYIQQQFEASVDKLRGLTYDFLDVRISKWHDDYHVFKNVVKDLEVMFTNVINNAFEGTTTVVDQVHLTETFFWLAKRDAVKRCVERKATETITKLMNQITQSRTEFESRRGHPPLRLNEPQYAGSALWANSLLVAIKEGYEALQRIVHLSTPRDIEELVDSYNIYLTGINDFKLSRYNTWMDNLNEKAKNNGLQVRLEKNIMRRIEGGKQILCNFDEDLLALFNEVNHWEKFHGEYSIPYVAHDICNKRDLLRVMREVVMLVVRAYNDILNDIRPDEKRMFVDQLRKLDKRMNQGLNKITWLNKNMIDMYIRDCIGACKEVHEVVKEFKDAKNTIRKACKSISNYSLVKIERSVLYGEGTFEHRQIDHHKDLHTKLEDHYKDMIKRLRETYRNFKDGSNEVQREWRSQITSIDKDVEAALKHSIKKSLQEFSKAINGDAKTDPHTLFTTKIRLDGKGVLYEPSMEKLTHGVNSIAKQIISCAHSMNRIKGQNFSLDGPISLPTSSVSESKTSEPAPTAAAAGGGSNEEKGAGEAVAEVKDGEMAADTIKLTNPKAEDKQRSFYETMVEDNDILRMTVSIMNGMSGSATELQKYLGYWDQYKALWEMDKDQYIRKYAKNNKPPSQFDVDVTKYRNLQSQITGETSQHIINFVRVDCNVMKDSLIGHCLQCQNKLTDLLHHNGHEELKSILNLFKDSSERLTVAPVDLDELSEKIGLRKHLFESLEAVQERFSPVHEVYNTLMKFDVPVAEAELVQLNGLAESFTEHKDMLNMAEKLLDKGKHHMKRDLEQKVEDYNTSITDIRSSSKSELPYGSDKSVDDAFTRINKYKETIANLKVEEASLIKGLTIFGTPLPENKELTSLNKDIDFLTQIWEITSEWASNWDSWKTGQFADLDVETLENVAGNYVKRVGKLGRDIKKWNVWNSMKGELDKFKETIPLIMDLRNQALRPRHWAALKERVDYDFDPKSADFTLNKVVELGLSDHSEFIGELSANANKELAIEVALADIEKRWAEIEMDIGTYKDKYYKMRSTDDLMQFLEDDAVALSTQKASKFYASFQAKIDFWEHSLSLVSEVIEAVLGVQRKWIYLESIFMSGGDISKQLHKEHALFVDVNNTWIEVMADFANHPIALKTCTKDGLLDRINHMDEGLEKIQKSLDQYLETKRNAFPRFYFVSDDDLLEILGQSKDPPAVQKHIKKCFEGIKSIKLLPPAGGQRTYEANQMTSPDGETCNFVSNLVVDGAVELWLLQLEITMKRAISKLLMQAVQGFKHGKKEDWVKKTAGQLLITTGSIMWTNECTKALNAISTGSKGALKQQKKKQVSYLKKLTEVIRGPLTKVERNKVVALITMEIHNRDVMDKMVKANCASVSDFEWLSQLRFVFDKTAGEFGRCDVKQTNSVLQYSYEYQGNNGRLVVTPLTDRCVLTLITAMYLNRGGNPLGPAGTGKTETVKDLGKNLAKYVVVINCSDGMDYKSVGRIFSGLVQSGSWGCFDEFNRIKIEVISVVAMQILSILNALSQKVPSFSFMGQDINCNPNCGIFITMNPGYAGRTELPDNLKALMRPVAMMAPDLTMIAEVMLASEGFNEAKDMAKKTVTLYSLMVQQLSKQDHYDYGLRNLKAVLNMAGQLKRADSEMPEESILMRALRDMNLPKFIKDDERLFRLLLGDLFPNLELPISSYGKLADAVEKELVKANLQTQEFLMMKIFQFYDSRMTRHCNMLVGDPMGGKSTAWRILAAAQSTLQKMGDKDFLAVTPYIISPKSVQLDELYGAYDLATFEWKDGILSTIFKSCSQDERPFEKWVLFDGPIDAMWIESMNSVMDDNKILTLINGDRIPLTPTMSLVFETQDLRVASPATVSRAGMIYIDASELGWKTYTDSWLNRVFPTDPSAPAAAATGGGDGDSKLSPMEELKNYHREMFEKWIPPLLRAKDRDMKEPVPVPDFVAVKNLCTLYDSLYLAEVDFFKDKAGDAEKLQIVERLFAFSIVWSIGAALDEKSRQKFSVAMSDIDGVFPAANTVYDYLFDVSKNDFVAWDSKVPSWRASTGMTFHDMIVPTVDTVRNSYLAGHLIKQKQNLMFVGATGTGKTILAQNMLDNLQDNMSQLVINFSAATTSGSVQEIIESPMEKRSKDKLGPMGGKKMVIFIDDFNMPKKTSFESPFQPPLELVRLWLDYNGWYDRLRCSWKFVLDTQMIVAMGHPGGGRNEIDARTQSRFSIFNLSFPADNQIVRIFDSILTSFFSDNKFEKDVSSLSASIATCTLNVYKSISSDFLATPEKFHYVFNIRDVAKVIQGVMLSRRQSIESPDAVIRLWAHECLRVFSDRLIRTKSKDEERFLKILETRMQESFQKDWPTVMHEALDPKVGPVFTRLMGEPGDEATMYEEIIDYERMRNAIEEHLEEYNLEPKLISMDLAMFKDAILHITRIHRILSQARGNMMLVGVGGSGRSSLARLSAYICKITLFTIEITKNYRFLEFREDIRKLYMMAGTENKEVMFLFNDTQIKDEAFLEDINNILSSGTVPNLFLKEDIPGIIDAVRKPALTAGVDETSDAMWAFFIDRVRSNLHVVLAMSPIGDSLRERCRMYPGLVNCTTIDWFHTWPGEALKEVAMKFLAHVEFNEPEYRDKISSVFAEMHLSVIETSDKMLQELKRHNYVTPTNYLELVKGYRTLLAAKSGELGAAANKLANGLAKLEDAKEQVEVLSKDLEVKKVTVAQSQKSCEDLLVQIVSDRRVADEQKKQVTADSDRIAVDAAECKAIADTAEEELAVAMPALEKAMAEVDKLDKSSISEVKAYAKPPALVETVMAAVMILFHKPTDWGNAKTVLSQSDFLQQIKKFDKDNVSQSINNKIKKYVENPDFTPEAVKKVSGAACALCIWVHAIYIYANVAKEVAPKRQRLKEATDSLAEKQANLAEATAALNAVEAKLAELQLAYDTSVGEKNELVATAEMLEAKLDRADKLVKGLEGEYVRWQHSITVYNDSLIKVTGDALVGAAFQSYAGPFETKYRSALGKQWSDSVIKYELPMSEKFNVCDFLANPIDVRQWQLDGLPPDDFSIENGVISTSGSRWPLMIDPQGQANRWIKKKWGKELKIIDLRTPGFLRDVENAVQYGFPVLLQDILEEMDPALEPVMSRSVMKIGTREVIKLGDKELDYSPDFKLYITTKLSNPHYTPEISTKATVVNFAVKKDGLEAQLLGIVVREEEPELEIQKNELTVKVATNKKQLVDLENEILRLLSESTGSLLDDAELVNTLQASKVTSESVTAQLKVAEETEIKIDLARAGYRPAAIRASLAYFILDDMSRVDPMYQFSLDSYVVLFNQSITNSIISGVEIPVHIRCDNINNYHTQAVYNYTCRGLFEAHKLLFSLQLCFRIMESAGKLPQEEFDYFGMGPGLIDRAMQPPNPAKDWLPEVAWDNITEMDTKVSGLSGIVASIQQNARDWKNWYLSGNPENEPMPGDWSTKTTELQRLCILRGLRIDRVLFGTAKFISANIGPAYVDPPSFDLKNVFETSTCDAPLIFVLSPGVDPAAGILQLGKHCLLSYSLSYYHAL
jgi:dynein heavy chain